MHMLEATSASMQSSPKIALPLQRFGNAGSEDVLISASPALEPVNIAQVIILVIRIAGCVCIPLRRG